MTLAPVYKASLKRKFDTSWIAEKTTSKIAGYHDVGKGVPKKT